MTTILAIIGILTAWFNHTFGNMNDDKSRKKYILSLEAQRPRFNERYYYYLGKGLDWLDVWFGAPMSARALTFNTGLAFFYAISLFALSWTLGGSGKIGDIEVFPESSSVEMRPLSALCIILAIIAIIRHRKIDSWIEILLSKRLSPKTSCWTYRLAFVAIILIIGLSLWPKNYLDLLSFSVIGIYSPTIVFAFAFAFAVAGAGAGAGAGVLILLYDISIIWFYFVNLIVIFLLFIGLGADVTFLNTDPMLISYLFFFDSSSIH